MARVPTDHERGPDIHLVSTYSEIVAQCDSVRQLLKDMHVGLHRDSALATLFRDARRAFDRAAITGEIGIGPAMRLSHVHRVASAVLDMGRDPGVLPCLKRMTGGTLDPSARAPSQGKDALWEIELAAHLHQRGVPARLEEPDLVVELGQARYPIACKRVYSERALRRRCGRG